MTQAKNTSNVHITSRNGYEVAITGGLLLIRQLGPRDSKPDPNKPKARRGILVVRQADLGARVYSTLNFSIPGSGSGSLGSIRWSASTRSCATATDFTQLRSAGTTCHGAHSVDVSVSAAS